ncbi:hypothetical protein L1987_49803 [Smallanthus sonchifolius]|uniref:Uncharacterized protein n=1 Tax=Smallanthus sonchifolius TaxID=185202 RepID=A0ACB9FVQ7_9ASTR|nr:hypothetical protein L1987_49803 [Smallanthus sonchifolius]
MSSKRGGGQFNKGKNIVGSSSLDVDQLNQAVQDVNLNSNHDADWEIHKPNPWGQSDAQRTGGRGNVQVRPPNNLRATTQAGGRYYENSYNPTSNAVPPPLQSGWNWNSRPGRRANLAAPQPADVEEDVDVEVHNDNDELYESDDELHFDEYDSDDNPISHEERKKNRWYADFFGTLDSLTVDQINEPTRQWHCPACQNGPGAIDWNTQLEQDENEKWVGMGNPELLDYFGSYEAVKARHSYGPKGHMSISVLIFDSSAVGYTEAERLSKHFENEGIDRAAWDRHRILFYSGGKRKLYGYMATKEDMDIFNKHSRGKSKLRFELVSYQEKVVDQLKQMNEENQQLHWYKTKEVKHQMREKELEESIDFVSERLRKREVEDRIKKKRTQQHCEELEEAVIL